MARREPYRGKDNDKRERRKRRAKKSGKSPRTVRRAPGRRYPPGSSRRPSKGTGATTQTASKQIRNADRRTVRQLRGAPGVMLGDQVLEMTGTRLDPKLGVMVTVNDEAGSEHGWPGWEVRLDELTASDVPPAWHRGDDQDGGLIPGSTSEINDKKGEGS